MNIATHFGAGYLAARCLRYGSGRFETFFLGAAAVLPDIDLVPAGIFRSVEHAGITHTVIGGAALEGILVSATLLALRGFLRSAGIGAARLATLAAVGLLLHLVLDVGTFSGACGVRRAHIYFWPLWDQSFHMDCLWAGVQRWHRVLVEVVVSAALAVGILVVDWGIRENNPIHAFDPRRWAASVSPSGAGRAALPALVAYIVFFAVLAVLFAGLATFGL
jgi:hypothetical protein